jgi:dTDP-4-amino-4,6-dideoxygalactose transaminase
VLSDGGCITTNDEILANKIRELRNYGSQVKYHTNVRGYNSRLDELQAAFLLAKLPFLDRDNKNRAKIAEYYNNKLSKNENIVIPSSQNEITPVWHLYVVRTKNRILMQEKLKSKGVQTLIHYPIPPHLQPAYFDMQYKRGDFPLSEKIHDEVISLPIGPNMNLEQAKFVVESILS